MPDQRRVNTQPVGGAFLTTPYTVFTPNYSPGGTTPLRPVPLPLGINQRDVNQALEAMAINNTYVDQGARPGTNNPLIRAETVASQIPTRGDIVGGYKHIDTMEIPVSHSEAVDNVLAKAEQDLVSSLQNPMAPAPRRQSRQNNRNTSSPRRATPIPARQGVTQEMRNRTQDHVAAGHGSMAGVGQARGTTNLAHSPGSRSTGLGLGGSPSANEEMNIPTPGRIGSNFDDAPSGSYAGLPGEQIAPPVKWKSKDGKHAILKVAPQLIPHLQEYFGDSGMIADYDGDGIPNEIDPTPNG